MNRLSHLLAEVSKGPTNMSPVQGHPSQFLQIDSFQSSQIDQRLKLFQDYYLKQGLCIESQNRKSIQIKLEQFDKTVEGQTYSTTPFELAKSQYGKAVQDIIVAEVSIDPSSKVQIVSLEEEDSKPSFAKPDAVEDNYILWDLNRPLEYDCSLKFLKFDSEKGQRVFWHSSAHILGAALEIALGGFLTIGPPLKSGFFYDAYMNKTVNELMYESLANEATKLVKENHKFERLLLTKEEALELFKDNPFKIELINRKVADGTCTTCYRCGPLVDLCCGPHIPFTGYVKAFAIEKHSSSYWLGDASNDKLQRVYGISFPNKKLMDEHKKFLAEAEERNHRKIGSKLNLFFFDAQLSPGSCFWLPDGAKIFNKLTKLLQREYQLRNFLEVVSPNIYSCDLFKISGHYQNYKENMYCFNVENSEWAMKPMNCPGHCIMFKQMNLSYRQLPLRLAEFGVLHRNEISGSLSGLTRVRRFVQDDAHIFCALNQLEDEIQNALKFVFDIYNIFNFSYQLTLSTRPEKAMGDISLWNEAETILRKSLESTGKPWTLNPGDGAFYGPKIDIQIQDALKRWHQCGTIQLDFQLPLQFNLQYKDTGNEQSPTGEYDELQTQTDTQDIKTINIEAKLKPGFSRPVMIHRAMLGSIERFTAILLEHTNGKLPFWLSPRQIYICPVTNVFLPYAQEIEQLFIQKGYNVCLNSSNATLNKKIREGQVSQWNYIFVIGQKEESTKTVTVRCRDDKNSIKTYTIDELVQFMNDLKHPFKPNDIHIL